MRPCTCSWSPSPDTKIGLFQAWNVPTWGVLWACSVHQPVVTHAECRFVIFYTADGVAGSADARARARGTQPANSKRASGDFLLVGSDAVLGRA